jgi:hypothetical protein
MSNLFWLTGEQMARLQPFVGKTVPGLFADPPRSPKATASLASMTGMS